MRTPHRLLIGLGLLAAILLTWLVFRRTFDTPLQDQRSTAAEGAPESGPAASGPGAHGSMPDDDEDVVARALRLAAIDTMKKNAWVDNIPDLELDSLPATSRQVFLRIANGRRCGCGCGFTLAGCRRFDSECETSGPRARALFDSVRAGQITTAAGFPERSSGR